VKVLRIAGCNLASLHGEFEVDLNRAPLCDAGLFAITGPTGSGKSTLLDALCLALFDKTPRLDGRSSVQVGAHELAPELREGDQDVRSLLSRGAADGWAEVDFVGGDRAVYRARWEVRRARRSSAGRLQNQDVSLLELPSRRPLGGTKSETLRAIEARVGLSFEQFRRSVLLAQGDFAAFLRAGADKRADLLERMTGADEFSEVSRRVHERTRELRAAKDEVDRRRAALGQLSDADREAKEARLLLAREEIALAVARVGVLDVQRQWYARADELERAALAARAQVEVARAAVDAAAPRRDLLARVQRAQPLRQLGKERDQARSSARQAADSAERAAQADSAAQAALARANDVDAAARAAFQAARDARDGAAEPIRQARRLDDLLSEAVAGAELAVRKAEASACVREGARQESARAAERIERARRLAARAGEWLAGHRYLEGLHGQWPTVARELSAWSEARAQRSALDVSLEELRARLAPLSAQTATVEAAHQSAEALLAAEASRQQGAEDALARVDAGGVEARRSRLERRGQQLAKAEAVAARASDAAHAVTQNREAAAHASERRDEATATAATTGAELAQVQARLEEAEGACRAAEDALSLEERRAELRPDEPCPLCGSLEHPFAAGDAVSALVRGARERRDDLRGRRTALADALAQLEAHAAAARTELAKLDGAAPALHEALTATRSQWSALIAELGEADAPEDPAEASGWLTAAAQAHGDAARASGIEVGGLEAARRAVESARAASDGARAAATAADRALRAHLQEVARLTEQQRELELRLSAADEHRHRAGQALRELLHPVPSWEERAEADAGAFGRALRVELDAAQGNLDDQERAVAELAEAQPELAAARVREEQAARQEEDAQKEAAAAREKWQALDRDRKALLEGRAADEVERELRLAEEARERERDTAAAAAAAAGRALEGARVSLAAAQERAAAAQAELEARAAELDGARARAGIAADELEALLAPTEAWIGAETQALEALDQSLHNAEAVRGEREVQRTDHLGAGAPELAPAELAQAVEAAGAQRDVLQAEVGRLVGDLARDDGLREQSAAMAAEQAELARALETWGRLNELVGSHDGKKLKVFAMGLALEELLLHANARLTELVPRYRLERIPGEDLELQVIDVDMGDERRSIHTLSGGETFLVSLALALGLSSMAARDVPLGSLFIDEGFGTLDRQSLDVALSVLEALQATGCQVGIISHVEGLEASIAAGVRVRPLGGGRSTVEVHPRPGAAS
jgi:exonuclease SbcC